MLAKDPYCEVYKTVFARAETHSRMLLKGVRQPDRQVGPASLTTVATPSS